MLRFECMLRLLLWELEDDFPGAHFGGLLNPITLLCFVDERNNEMIIQYSTNVEPLLMW